MREEKSSPAFENIDYYIEIGEHIKFYRKQAKLTQEELAHKVNVTRSYMSRVEKQNTCQPFSLELMFNICRVLEIEPIQLFQPYVRK